LAPEEWAYAGLDGRRFQLGDVLNCSSPFAPCAPALVVEFAGAGFVAPDFCAAAFARENGDAGAESVAVVEAATCYS